MTSILFPALLAGPIIRRVDSSQAYIWVATSKNYNIGADCFAITTKYEGNQYEKLKTRTKTETVHFGKNLYIHLVKILPIGEFRNNQLIGYNLHFKNSKESFDLDDLGLLNPVNPNSIVYGSLKYPSFFITEKDSNTSANFLYGSCRKPHGEGEDTLSYGDQLLEETCRNITERPEALFLMGDQIYADDIPDPLFRQIHILGNALMGKGEDLLVIDPRLKEEPFNFSMDKINGRKSIIQKIAQFTSGKSFNHLIEFGEYAAMYLFAWSPVFWNLCDQYKLNETFDEAVEKEHIYIRSKSDQLKLLEKLQLKKRFTDQEKHLVNYQKSVMKIRRLMANIPTYMIFDDHDITDDWNITLEWKERVKASPLGKHIVANGLAAFWAFQGWGNQPALYKRPFIALMEGYFREILKEKKKKAYYHSWIKLLWEHRPWYFVAPTSPIAVFLDTRTMRSYEKANSKEQEQLDSIIHPPQLVNEIEIRGLRHQLKNSGWQKGSPLLIISPTPIIGFELIETVITKFSIPLKMVGVSVETVFDMEAWRYNGKGLTKILNQLAEWKPSECIILSGDVHYSFLVDSFISFPNGSQIKIKQITSSPLKNMSFHMLGPLVKFAATVSQVLQEEELVYRYCDTSYHIHNVKKENLPANNFLWKDELKYNFVNDTSIIETENNLGVINISSKNIETNYIKKEEKDFN